MARECRSVLVALPQGRGGEQRNRFRPGRGGKTGRFRRGTLGSAASSPGDTVSRAIFATAALVWAASIARSENRELDLLLLVRAADRIVVGRVVEVHEIESQGRPRVAEVEVLRRLTGPEGKRLFVLASGTWVCDESRAVAGERAVFFLRPIPNIDLADTGLAPWTEDPAFLTRVKTLRGEAPFLRIAWSGWGRMPIRERGKETLAETRFAPLRAPASIPSIPWPCPQYSFVRSVPLDALLTHVEALVRVPPAGPLRELVTGDTAARQRALEAVRGDDEVLIAALVARLDETRSEIWEAANEVCDVGGPTQSRILRLGDHPMPLVREAAGRALHPESCREALASEDVATRRLAVAAFRARARHDWTPDPELLAPALKDGDETVRVRAAHALGMAAIGFGGDPDRLAPWLIRAAADPSATVRRIALGALGREGRLRHRGEHGDRAELVLLAALDDADLWVRRAAAEGLASVASALSRKALVKRPVDADPLVRGYVMVALGQVGVTKPLATALGDPDPWIRRSAALGLGRSRMPAAIEPLARAFEDADVDVRRIALDALEEVGGPAAVKVIEKALNDEDETVRVLAQEALRTLKRRLDSDR